VSRALVFSRVTGPDGLDDVLAIDRESFSRPWTRQMYEDDLRNPQSRIWVARRADGLAVAYCAVWVILDELHINNVAVSNGARRQGVATELVSFVLGNAAREGAVSAMLEVRRTNVAARRLYESVGFRQVGLRERYYEEPVDDALILRAEIQGFGDSPDA
jgi:ribosomal-protein-alanine N-acetyltransferase